MIDRRYVLAVDHRLKSAVEGDFPIDDDLPDLELSGVVDKLDTGKLQSFGPERTSFPLFQPSQTFFGRYRAGPPFPLPHPFIIMRILSLTDIRTFLASTSPPPRRRVSSRRSIPLGLRREVFLPLVVLYIVSSIRLWLT